MVRKIRGALWSPCGGTTDSLVSRQRADEPGTEPRMANLPHGMGRARVVRAHVPGLAGTSSLHHVDLRGLIRDLGFKTIMFDRDYLARQLETLIDAIDMIKWSEVSPQNRALPNHACDTIVSIAGNWVAFDAEVWETQMDDSKYLILDEWGAKSFDHPRDALTVLIDRRAEEKRTTRTARVSDDGGVPQRFRLLELEAPADVEVREAPQPQEEAPLRFPNAKAHRRLARTLDFFMVKTGVKPLITDYKYPEGLTLDNMEDIVRLHLGTCAKHRSSAG